MGFSPTFCGYVEELELRNSAHPPSQQMDGGEKAATLFTEEKRKEEKVERDESCSARR